jgi:TMEM175 potassium channel family protein
MPSDEDPADARQFVSTTRLEAFSDGVFAIAITLLVLEIALRPPGSPLEQVLHAWPSYLAYVVSFLTIGAAWLGHNAMTDRLERADQILLRINLLLLLVVVFLPFPTRLVAESLHDIRGERVFVVMYGLTLLAIRAFGFALDEYGRREHLDSPEGAMQERRAESKLLPVVIGYVIALLIGLVFPGLAVAAYFAIAVYLVVPFREVTRLLFPPSQRDPDQQLG